MKERKIGVMGGTFNPIHYAHLLLAESAREQFALDRVIFMPTGTPYMKDTTNLPPGELRYQLVKLAIRDNAFFTCSRLEIDRPGNTYTADTLRELHHMYPGDHIYFIMGADAIMDIEKWHRAEEVLQGATILAAVRKKIKLDVLRARRQELIDRYCADIELLEYGRIDISSTMIRDRLSRGLSVRYLLPDECIEFIRTRNFYSEKSEEEAPSKVYIPEKRRHKVMEPPTDGGEA